MEWLTQTVPAFIGWIFSWEWDKAVLPWLDANKLTFGFLIYAPWKVYEKYRVNRSKIIQLDKKYDKIEAAEDGPVQE